MMELLIAILVAYGISNIIVNGSIFEPLRNWFGGHADKFIPRKIYQLITCMMCTGFWVGVVVGCFLGPFPWWHIIFNGAIYSGTTWLIYCIAQFLGQGYDPSRVINVQIEEPITIREDKDGHQEDSE
jgi:prepilin signal peptidase PulO-like enzyme (type II secretory pathway)